VTHATWRRWRWWIVIGVVLLIWLLAILAANTLTGNDPKTGIGMLALGSHALL
jgi:hypothetical protein